MTTEAEWLEIQQGKDPHIPDPTGGPSYIHDGLGLTTAVHFDAIYELPHNAALILLNNDVDFDPGNPLVSAATQEGFVDFDIGDMLTAVADVARPALHAAWVQKWDVHRRPRPEALGGHVNAHLKQDGIFADFEYDLPKNLLNSQALQATFDSRTGDEQNYLLSTAYPEGSPTHPAYPAGHSTFAGACVTVLKAYFDEDAAVPNPVHSPDGSSLEDYTGTLTVGDELNKLADNIAIGRNWAGIHYRTDATEGYRLGEDIAIGYLTDRARSYDDAYGFEGFSLTRFNGDSVVVGPDGVN
jgi:hypothetical protein